MANKPLVSFVTMSGWGPVYPRIARWLGSGLAEIGASADIVFLEGPEGVTPKGSVREIRLGIHRARLAVPRLKRYLCEQRPSMTLATPATMGLLCLTAGKEQDHNVVPWQATMPRLDTADLRLYLRAYLASSRRLYARAARVAAVSEAVRRSLADDLSRWVPPERLVVIPNPVDGAEIRRQAQPVARRGSRLRFCSVGRLVSAKGFDVLIEAFALADLGDTWELLIVGDGPLRLELEQLTKRRGLDEHVTFLGPVANPYPIVASADIAVQASRWEGFGMAMLEALSLGVPLIATDCPGGVSEIVGRGQCAMLVAPDDPTQLARTLGLVASDAELRRRLSERGPLRAAEYAPVRVAETVVSLAEEVRGDPSRNRGVA